MAYFSNGSEGMQYQSKYCDHCINWREDPDVPKSWGCPIIDLHMDGNYDQCKDTPAGRFWKKVLEQFIPTGEDHFAKQCRMFLKKPCADIPGQMKMFAEAAK